MGTGCLYDAVSCALGVESYTEIGAYEVTASSVRVSSWRLVHVLARDKLHIHTHSKLVAVISCAQYKTVIINKLKWQWSLWIFNTIATSATTNIVTTTSTATAISITDDDKHNINVSIDKNNNDNNNYNINSNYEHVNKYRYSLPLNSKCERSFDSYLQAMRAVVQACGTKNNLMLLCKC